MDFHNYMLFMSLYASSSFSMLFIYLLVRYIKTDKESGIMISSIIASVSWAVFYQLGGFS